MKQIAGIVHRTRPLPIRRIQGRFILGAGVIAQTRDALLAFARAGSAYGGHEGICYWAGQERGDQTYYERVYVPEANHGPGSVFVDAASYGAIAREARAAGLGLLAQIHSHPGHDTRHSDGDDDLIIMPFPGMLSLVAPYYGRTLTQLSELSTHQYQSRQWVQCCAGSVASAFSGELSV